ncbi:MAG: ATP synthase F0 subunit C [Candidatus Limivicinus sp.]|jgi:F-type H+-transporting ATPase subunit c
MLSTVIVIAVALIMMCAVIVPALAQAKVASKAIESMARQPEVAGQLRSTLILVLGMIEALAIYGLLIGFMLLGKI